MPKLYDQPSPGEPFDPELFRLGKPCKRNHIHANGMTLRFVPRNGKCLLCERIDSRERSALRRATDPDFVERQKNYALHYQRRLRQNPEYRRRAAVAIAEKRKREGRPSRSKHGLPYTRKGDRVVIEMRAAIRRAGKLPSVTALVQQQQTQHWAANPDDRRTIMTPWNVQQAQWLYLTDHSYRLYQRQKSKHYKARKRGNHSSLIPGAQLLNRWAEFGHACAYCGRPDHRADELELEHVIPISEGGGHHLGNIVPACHKCNSSKRSRDALAWYQEQPFYSETRWKKICAILNKETAKWQQMRLIA